MTSGDISSFLKELIRLEYNMAFTWDICLQLLVWLWVLRGRTRLEEISSWECAVLFPAHEMRAPASGPCQVCAAE